MTKTKAREILSENKDSTAYFDGSIDIESFQDMLRYRMRFGAAETEVITAALILAGAKFAKNDIKCR